VMCASIQDPGGGGVGVAGAVQPLKELFMASHVSCTSSGGCCSQGGEGGGRGMPAHAHWRQGRELRLIVAVHSWPVVW
jgi:hypothetical protein